MQYVIVRLLVCLPVLLFGYVASKYAHPHASSRNKEMTGQDTSAFNFFVLGDWGRRGTPDQQAVADQMITLSQQTNPSFIVTTGDNFYEEGARDINDPHWKTSWMNVYKNLTGKYVWYPVLGNHEYEGSANPEAEIQYSAVNAHWSMPAHYYTMVQATKDNQKVRFVFIDTSPFEKKTYKSKKMPFIPLQDTAKQRQWIDSVLAAATEPWKIVIGHHPVYSSGSAHGNTIELIDMLKPMLEKYKVQAYLCGHDHDLQHQRPSGSYTDYFLSGAGSAVRPSGISENTLFARSVPGFADISITGDSLYLTFIDKNGNRIYNYSRSK